VIFVSDSLHRVAIVVDPAFGGQLAALAARVHVWIADTAVNRPAAERVWAAGTPPDLGAGVTTFKVDSTRSPDDWCAAIVGTVQEHHGEFSHDPAVSELEVYGTPPTGAVRAAFAEYGFDEIEITPGGFKARSRPAS
jgi:hypothetical protein